MNKFALVCVFLVSAGCASSSTVQNERSPAAEDEVRAAVAAQAELTSAYEQISAPSSTPETIDWSNFDNLRGKQFLCYNPRLKRYAVTTGDSIYTRRKRHFANFDNQSCKEVTAEEAQALLRKK